MDVMTGVLDVTSNAGDGHKGQDGGAGAPAAASGHTVWSMLTVCNCLLTTVTPFIRRTELHG